MKTLAVDLENHSESLKLLLMALDQLWEVCYSAMISGYAGLAHHKVNCELI